MAKPTEKVRLQKQEIPSLGGDPNDVSADPTPLNPTEDVAQVAGVEFCAPGKVGDSKVMIWREGDALAFEDPIAGVRTLNDLLTYTQAHSHAISDVNGLQAALNSKADKATTYTKQEVDNALSVKANSADVYDKTTADSRFKAIDWTPTVNDIPGLPASKITSGTFNAARIPTLDASKIGTGTFAAARIPTITDDKLASGIDWNKITKNKPTTIKGFGITDAASQLYVQSRGVNLVTNGTALFGDNTNFSTLIYDGSDSPGGGGGCFVAPWGNLTAQSDELIPIDTNKTYDLCGWVKADPFVPGSRFYFGLGYYDIDKKRISNSHWNVVNGTKTVLTQPLKPGDTVVHVQSVAGWRTSDPPHTRSLAIFGYKNSFGYLYSNYTRYTVQAAWAADGIDTINNRINLLAPLPESCGNPDHPEGEWPIGTPVANTIGGDSTSSYLYTNQLLTNEWQKLSASVGPSGSGATPYPGGTGDTANAGGAIAFAQIIMLSNRSSASPNATKWANIWFGEKYVRPDEDVVFHKTVKIGSNLVLDTASNLDATKLIGSIHPDRIPTLAKSKISGAGTWSETDLPTISKSKISTAGQWPETDIPVLTAAKIPSLDASKITTGTFHADRIPTLSADKITEDATHRFFTDTERAKLAGIKEGATNTPLTNTAPQNVRVQTAAAGTSLEAARADHKHNVSVGTPVAIGTTNSAGTATSLARSDHVHAHGTISAADSHPISAITGLQAALDGKFSTSGGKITGNVIVTGHISLTGDINAIGSQIGALGGHFVEVYARSFWSAYPDNSTDTAFQFYTGPHLGKLFSISKNGAEKFYIDNNGDAWANGVKLGGSYTLPAASTSTRGGIRIGDGLEITGWPDVVSVSPEIVKRSRSLFTLNVGGDPLVWKLPYSGQELFNRELHRFKVDLSHARMVRMSMILVYSEGKDGELVLEGSTDGGNNWGPLDGGMTGSMGPGGPAIMTIVGGPSSEYQMSGGRDTHLTSGWTKLDSNYAHDEVWLRIVYYGKTQQLEFGSISAEATYYYY